VRSYFVKCFFTSILVLGWLVILFWFAEYTLKSPQRTNPITIEIPPKSSLNQIGDLLKEKKIIRESYFFRIYAFLKRKTNLKAGVYEIHPNHDLDYILKKLSVGKEDLIKIILPPGFTTVKLAERLGAHGFNKETFLKMMNNKKPKYGFEERIPKDPRRTYRLEGYLFPGTYYFKKNEKPEVIINAMLKRLSDEVNQLQAYKKLGQNKYLPLGMTIDKWVIVASLIERECQVKQELPRVSGVIYNRMRNPKNNKLMIDASIIYIYGLQGKNLNYVTQIQIQQTKHPYNTYLNPGLPPGPICSPSKDALIAALNPDKHSFEFYVTKKDGTHQHYFAKTYEEHQRFDALSAENEKKLKHKK
jgi:UPF0755 protein